MEQDRLRMTLCIALCVICGGAGYAPGEQREVLLFGNTYDAVTLKINGRAVDVPAPPGFRGQGLASLPSLSPDGNFIAWGLTLPYSVAPSSETEEHPKPFAWKSVLGIYSTNDRSWRFYGDFCGNGVGSTAFAADGKRIAFLATKALSGPNCSASPELDSFQLHILDLQSGSDAIVPDTGDLMMNAAISWSPDGKYVVGQIGSWVQESHQLVVIELATGTQRIIADGIDPSWSPSGEWIAYLTDRRDKCVLIHADGTGAHAVRGSHSGFSESAVWSPDSKSLLLNEGFFDEKNDVLELALPSDKGVRKMPRLMYAFGWAMTSQPSPEGDSRQH